MPRDGGIRECYLPDNDEVLIACDYAALELCSVAQCMYDIFGKSKMRDLLNEGKEPTDIHAIMGAYLYAADRGINPDVELFKQLKDTDPKTFKEYRTRGKPVGLGFFGGLGASTMVKVARGQGVKMTEEEAMDARRIHAKLFPEVVDYLGYNTKRDDEYQAIKGGGWLESAATEFSLNPYGQYTPLKFAYSVNGRYRNNCTYCSCANGRSMQSPSADGAKESIFLITRACFDETRGNILFGSKPKAFIHDEIIISCGGSDEEQKEKAKELGRLMQVGMQLVMPNVRITTEAGLMDRWSKDEDTHLWTHKSWTDVKETKNAVH
jgi:DNA polymerase I-like protein with 3'-5' exonuclease and polymerase domains